MRTDVSTFYLGTGTSVTPVKHIPIRKSNMKSPTMSHPKKDPIPNQDINRLITEQDPIIPPIIENTLLDINHFLMICMIQIVQKTTLII